MWQPHFREAGYGPVQIVHAECLVKQLDHILHLQFCISPTFAETN